MDGASGGPAGASANDRAELALAGIAAARLEGLNRSRKVLWRAMPAATSPSPGDVPNGALAPAGRPGDVDLDMMIAKGETCCATYRRALAAATDEQDARLLRGVLYLEQEALADLRARRDRLAHRPKGPTRTRVASESSGS